MKKLRTMQWVLPLMLVALTLGCPRPSVVVTLSPLTADLVVGGTLTLNANSSGPMENDFSWTVSDDTVVSLSAATGESVTVTALAEGTATVTVTGDRSGVATSATITVVEPPDPAVAIVTLNPAMAELEVGDTYDLTASSSDPADTTFNWTTSNVNVAPLSADSGTTVTVTAQAVGESHVTATGAASGETSSVHIVVVAPGQGTVVPPGSQLAPGLKVSITDVTIPEDRRPLVTFTATDDDDNLVAKKELSDARFLIAYLQPGENGETNRYLSYINRTENPDGVPNNGDEEIQATLDGARLAGVTENGDGTMTYRFATAIPEGYDAALTHQVAGQARRTYAVDGESYLANPTFVFRPDGEPVTEQRRVSDTATCNKCHVRMGFHGGSRREYQFCIVCHNTGSTDANTDNTVDMAVMIHKIHMGEDLPSVQAGEPYRIFGNQNSIHDYSTVVFPQPVQNCNACHDEDNPNTPDATIYETSPTLAGCASCHDRTWFGPVDQTPEGFTNHTAGPQADSSDCATCHTQELIEAVHVTPQKSLDAPGLELDITDVQASPEDGTLRIQFTAMNGAGEPITDLATLNRIAATYAYYVPDYEAYATETIFGSGVTGSLVSSTSPTGEYDFTFGSKLPVGTGKTFAVGLEGRVSFQHNGETYRQGTATNGLTYFTVDGGEPESRRMPVTNARCNACHDDIRAHGESRVGVEYCVLCHTPSTTDESERPAEAMPPVTVNFKDMLHLIHSGENLEQGYTVYGHNGSVNDFGEVRFPADRRNCDVCHVPGAETLPLEESLLPTVVTEAGETVSVTLPESAACTTCHDSVEVQTHAFLNSTTGVETCVVCHGEGSLAAVTLMHEVEP